MLNKLFAFFVFGVLMLNSVGATFADTKNNKSVKNQTDALVALLPASDAAAAFDVKKFFDSALPQILSNNQPMLAKILAHVDEIKTKTGIDPRQFEQIAVGVGIKKISAKEFDFAPVALMRGQINSNALISVAKLAANGKYREVKLGDRTIYVFDIKAIADAHNLQNANNEHAEMIAKARSHFNGEIAVAAFDNNTLAVGTEARVRQTLAANDRIAADISGLMTRSSSAIFSFAGKTPGGLSGLVPLDNDELGKNIDAIQYLYGSADVGGTNTTVQVTARTIKNEQAQGLLETLQGLQMIGKAFLGSSKTPQKQVYGHLIDNAKFSRSANEVMLDLQVPQTDIDVLVAAKK